MEWREWVESVIISSSVDRCADRVKCLLLACDEFEPVLTL